MKKLSSMEAIRIYNFAFDDRQQKDEKDYLSANRLGAISYKLHNLLTEEGVDLLLRYLERCGKIKNLRERTELELALATEMEMTFRKLDESVLKSKWYLREDDTLPLMITYDERELKEEFDQYVKEKDALTKFDDSSEELDVIKSCLAKIRRVPYLWTYERYSYIKLSHIGAGLSKAARKVAADNGLVTISDIVQLGDDFWELKGITDDVADELIKKVDTQKPNYMFRPEKR